MFYDVVMWLFVNVFLPANSFWAQTQLTVIFLFLVTLEVSYMSKKFDASRVLYNRLNTISNVILGIFGLLLFCITVFYLYDITVVIAFILLRACGVVLLVDVTLEMIYEKNKRVVTLFTLGILYWWQMVNVFTYVALPNLFG